jgi:hypothetical protein
MQIVSFSDYLEDAINNAVCNNTSLAIAQVYVKLHIGDPGENGTSNAAAETTRKAVSFGASVSGTAISDADVTWTNVAGTETISYISYWDHVSAGNCLGSGPLTSSQAVSAGDTLQALTGNLTFTSA